MNTPNTVGIIGTGKLGLCFALNLDKAGFNVVGQDINDDYIHQLNNRVFRSKEPNVEDYLQKCNIKFTTSLSEVADKSDILFVLVQTPTAYPAGYDHSILETVLEDLKKLPKPAEPKTLVIGCTVLPGFCDLVKEELKEHNYILAYNPEFIAQGSIIRDQQQPDMILVGAEDEKAFKDISLLHLNITKGHSPRYCTMDLLSAELCKISLNCAITTKIALANSIGDLCRKVGADADKVLGAIGEDSRINPKYFKYGFGFGGPCFPRDNRALYTYADSQGYDMILSKATDNANKAHLDFQYDQCDKNSDIIFDGVTYKPGVPMLDESQSLALALKLANAGAKVTIVETPEVIKMLKKEYEQLFIYKTPEEMVFLK